MGTFAETAIVDYRLLFANQVKQTSVFHFRLQQTNGSLLFPFSANKRKQPFHYIYTGWGGESWTIFCGPASVAMRGCERKD
jgi:hypothetical protein